MKLNMSNLPSVIIYFVLFCEYITLTSHGSICVFTVGQEVLQMFYMD